MNTSLVIITSDKIIGIGTTTISGIGTDMSWIPSNVHACLLYTSPSPRD